MLDLGFLPDIKRVIRMYRRQADDAVLRDDAGPILTLARSFMVQPRTSAPNCRPGAGHASTTQFVYRAHALDKVGAGAHAQARGRGLTMVFTRTKRMAAKVADELTDGIRRGGGARRPHPGRARAGPARFRSGEFDVLVATDVAARGIDVADVTHVINYECPEDEKTYVHRIGRTGRAGKTGVAVSFMDWDDLPRWD